MKAARLRLSAATLMTTLLLTACGGGDSSTTSSSGTSTPAPAPAPTTYILTTIATGSGTIASSPAGITCGAACSASFNSGAGVTLTATPASGYTFSGWGGVCSGTGSCAVTMSAARSATATFIASSPPPAGVTYYFSDCQEGAAAGCVAGNNLNEGTSPSAPKQTLAGFDINAVPAGTRLLFARGGVWLHTITRLDNNNATPAAPLLFADYGTGLLPWFKAPNVVPSAFEFGGWNNTNNDGGYTLRNLKIDGLGTGSWGLHLRDNLRNLTIENVEITGFGIAIHSQPSAPYGITNVILRNSSIHHNNDMGILGKFTDSLFEGNTFEANNFSGSAFSHAIYMSGSAHGGNNNIIRNNRFINNSVANGTCNGGNVTFHGTMNGMLMENNTITQTASTGGCYGISITSGYNSPEWFRNFTIRGNTIVNVGYVAIAVHAAPGIVIENNKIRNTQTTVQHAVSLGANDGEVEVGDDIVTGAVVRNNIVCYAQPHPNSRTVAITAPATGTETGTIYQTGAAASTGACAIP